MRCSIETDSKLFMLELHTARLSDSEIGCPLVSKVCNMAGPSVPAGTVSLFAVRMRTLLGARLAYTPGSGIRWMVHPLSMAVEDHFQPGGATGSDMPW